MAKDDHQEELLKKVCNIQVAARYSEDESQLQAPVLSDPIRAGACINPPSPLTGLARVMAFNLPHSPQPSVLRALPPSACSDAGFAETLLITLMPIFERVLGVDSAAPGLT
jgi:hypothetical protein